MKRPTLNALKQANHGAIYCRRKLHVSALYSQDLQRTIVVFFTNVLTVFHIQAKTI